MKVSCVILAACVPLFVATACHAEQSDYLSYKAVAVPFNEVSSQDDPGESYREFIQQLKDRASAEARDETATPIIHFRHWGRMGERMLIGAITPRSGVFYMYVPPNHRASQAHSRGSIEACRFTVEWAKLPGGAYASSINWAGLAFPSIDCKPPTSDQLSKLVSWRRTPGEYVVAAQGTQGRLNAVIIREVKKGSDQVPPDSGAAIKSWLGASEQLDRIVPLAELRASKPVAFAQTSRNRSLVVFHDPRGVFAETNCIVEGLNWADISQQSATSVQARRFCDSLFAEERARYLEKLDEDFKVNPPVLGREIPTN